MMRYVMFVFALMTVAGVSVARGDDTPEVKQLKAEVELLKSKLEVANLKVEKLEAENVALKQKIGGQADPKQVGEKLTYTKKSAGPNGGDEVLYTLGSVSRQGRKVTFEFTATLKKGNRKNTLIQHITGLDQDGNEVVLPLNPGERAPKNIGVQAKLVLGEAVKLVAWAEVPDEVKKFKTIKFTSGLVTKLPEIEFENFDLPVKK